MHFWKWPSVSNKNRFFNYINNSALPKNNSLSESTLTLTWTSAKLGGGTRVFLRWTGYSGDLTGPSCFNWGAEMAVQGHALNTHGPIFEITLCACSLDMFLLFSMWTFSEMSQTKPAHTPHTVVKLQVLTDFSFFFSCMNILMYFSAHKGEFHCIIHDMKSVLWREINHHTHRLLRPAWEQQPIRGTSSFCETNRRREATHLLLVKKTKKNKITLKSIKTH